MLDPVPVKYYGQGNLAITSVQQVEVTEDFLGLSETIRECQETEDSEHCHTNTYLDKAKSECDCAIPFNDSPDVVSFKVIRDPNN